MLWQFALTILYRTFQTQDSKLKSSKAKSCTIFAIVHVWPTNISKENKITCIIASPSSTQKPLGLLADRLWKIVTKFFTPPRPKKKPFLQLLRVTRKCSCTSAGNEQAQLHFRDDQQRAFGISNISHSYLPLQFALIYTVWRVLSHFHWCQSQKNCTWYTVPILWCSPSSHQHL